MSSMTLDLRQVSIISNIGDKNAQAQQIIKRYADQHALMDIGIGVVSLIPGAAIPAIMAAIALQSKVIYRPMAEELAKIYLAEADAYTDKLGMVASISTVALEFGQEFAIEFLTECAQELIVEAGMGTLATFIPFAGAAVAAGLDYFIAQMLTWRVGTMTSIYFQNGGAWVADRKSTMHIAKGLTGGLTVSMSDAIDAGRRLFAKKEPSAGQKTRVDFNEIPNRVPQVKSSGVNNVMPLIKSFADKLPREAVRESLIAMGLSAIIVDAALHLYYSGM